MLLDMVWAINSKPQQRQGSATACADSGIEGGRRLVSDETGGPATALHGGMNFCEGGHDLPWLANAEDALGCAEFPPL